VNATQWSFDGWHLFFEFLFSGGLVFLQDRRNSNLQLIKIQLMKKDNENKSIREKREMNDARNKSGRDQKLPGEYPPNEDIMNRLNEVERVSLDPDDLSSSKSGSAIAEKMESPFPQEKDTHSAASGESNLTKEDFEALGPKDLSLDGGDDEQLKHRVWPVDFSAKDLDVPNGNRGKGDSTDQGDEENDHYSLGGDDKENLEDDPTRTFG
jgi:hypothetical protein